MESELVSGFMTEHAAAIFVFFFLAEYASIVLICILISILFFGGYLLNTVYLLELTEDIFNIEFTYCYNTKTIFQFFVEGLLNGVVLGLKTSVMVFIFIWVRASFPRIRFDQLMSFCWTILLPVVIAFIILVPCILYGLDMITHNIYLF